MDFGSSNKFTRFTEAGKINLDKATMINILVSINDELMSEGLHATMMVYGGCAMMLHGYDTRRTRDIDAAATGIPMADFSSVLDRVVKNSNPPFTRSLFDTTIGPLIALHSKKNELDELEQLSNLRVMIASPKQMLALKLFSARNPEDSQDLGDAIMLCKHLGLSSRESFKEVLLEYIKEDSVNRQNNNPDRLNCVNNFMDMLFEEVNE